MASAIGKKVHEVATRVLTDPEFANQVRAAALRAVKAGRGSAEFLEYFELFAPTPGALAGLSGVGPCPCESNTLFTISSLVGPLYTCCATTTTTTTSGNYFGT